MDPKDPKNPDPKGSNPPADPDNGGEDDGGTPKTYSQDELDSANAKARRAAEDSTRKKLEKQYEDQRAKDKAEWERQAALSAEDKANEERKAKDDELAQKEREIALRENRADARELLQEKSISADLVDWVVDVDADKTKDNIEKLEKVWNKAIEDGVAKKVAGSTPKDKSTPKGGSDDSKTSTRDLLYGKKG
jgi:hypothetical protein